MIAAAVWLLVIGWLLWQWFREVRGERETRRPRSDDRAVTASLYPTTGRGTVATPKRRPAAADTAPALTTTGRRSSCSTR